MADKITPTGNSGLSANLLPKFYQTPANKKFLQATIDQLFQPGSVNKINGFVGRQNAKAATGSDIYVAAADTTRGNYQLEPGIVIKDAFENVTFFKDYQDYVNQIKNFGGNVSDHNRLNQQEMYSWDPHIDWDKFVNFQNYYWLSYGPELITIHGQGQSIESTYSVDLVFDGNANNYVFTPDGIAHNPILKLYRGHTYNFEINSPGNPFSLKTSRSLGSLNRIGGIAAGVEKGTITYTVPNDAPNTIYYQSETDINVGGTIEVYDVTDATYLDINSEILGKKSYTMSNGISLSNGMLIEFAGKVTPASYATGNYYVEGVGSAIKLVSLASLEIIGPYTVSEEVQFDQTPFDSTPFDGATGFASELDYITVNRASKDRNPWSRYNRWVHKDVIIASAEFNNNVPVLDQSLRAIRPIIEFDADLKLFNLGTRAIDDVDVIDTYTTDIFSIIEGSIGYNVDGINLSSGYKLLAAADTDPLVRNKIFQVETVTINGVDQLHLVEVATPQANDTVLVRRGKKNQGIMYWFNGSTWVKGQEKTTTNQSPLFDVVDNDGVSYGDTSVYPGSTFIGTSLFTYKLGSGVSDTVLGFPLSYKNVSNIGDIVFNFTLATDTFQYKQETSVITKSIEVGYLVSQTYGNEIEYVNGWQKTNLTKTQAGVRIYNNEQVNNYDIDIYDDVHNLDDLIVKVYVNGIRLDPSKWSVVTNTVYKQVVLNTNVNPTDIVTLRTFANQPINSKGFYEIPVNLQNNPLNNTIGDFTLGEVIDHVNSIIDNTQVYAGNLRDLGEVTANGTKFVQHGGPLSLSLYHITSQDNNIVSAIERSRDDYANFKRMFIVAAENLGIDAEVDVMVDLVMQKLNANKPKTSPYYFSDMVPYGAKIVTNLKVVDSRVKTYPLSKLFTLTELSSKAVGVYLNGEQLVYGRDYTFDSLGVVNVTAGISVGDVISTYEYENTDGCFVPSTPTKLGLWPKFVPQKYLDTSLVTPREMIQCHDGSLILAYGDYRDDLLIELEKRIYNNIKVEYNTSIFDIADIIPGYNRDTGYSLAEFNNVLAPNFYKWTGFVGVDFTKPLTYDRQNSFTFNYSSNYAPDGSGVPAYWRGIYRWMLDTDRPHLTPWEMLGFSIEPSWWTSVYGPAPYTSDNQIMWSDLANGVVREPGVPPYRVNKYVRPILQTRLPVDDQGNLVSPLYAGMVSGVVSQSTDNNFVFGDVSPVEAAWRRSSHYPFSVLIASLLLTPARTFGLALDRSRIIRNKAGQLVYADTNLRIRPQDIILPTVASSNVRVQAAGIVNYVVDYIMNYIFSNNLVAYNHYVNDLKTMIPQLSYRLGSFANKDQFKFLLESKTPVSSGNVFIPSEDYNIFLNKSSATTKLTYSGVIVTKLSSGYEIKGYSRTAPYFKYYNYLRTGSTINVGGISAPYSNWTVGSRYNVGTIVKYGESYYAVKVAHTATSFDDANYSHLPALPIVGGVNVQLRTAWDKSQVVVAPYGITFKTQQEVADFMAGYAEWLKDQGFIFNDFDATNNVVSNWDTSVKEFLFWSTQNWSTGQEKWSDWEPNVAVQYGTIVRYNGEYYSAIYNIPASIEFDPDKYNKLDGLSNVGSSVISLSPAAKSVKFTTNLTVVDAVGNPFNPYEIFKVDGTPIEQQNLDSYRDGNVVTYSTSNGDGIFGASFYLIQNEHVAIINNTTIFNDTIYSPESGYRQERIKVSAYVTTDWYGGFDIPGFVFDQAYIAPWQEWQDYKTGDVVNYQGFYYAANEFVPGAATFTASMWNKLDSKPTPQVLPNWTNLASQFVDFYSLETDSLDPSHQQMAQHLIGYQKRQYLENIIQDDVSEFKFFQGMIRDKGTQNVLNKLFNPLGADNTDSLVFYEEWALRIGQYGATASFDNIEFVLREGEFKNNPQGVQLSATDNPKLSPYIIEQLPNDVYLKPSGYNSKPFPINSNFTPFLRTPGYVDPNNVFLTIPTIGDIVSQDITTFTDGVYVWCTFAPPQNPFTNPLGDWGIYKYSYTNLTITSVTYDSEVLTFEASSAPFVAGDYVGIFGDALLNGFYQVATRDSNSFTINHKVTGWSDPYENQSALQVGIFISRRVVTIDDLDNVTNNVAGDLVWADSNVASEWTTWEFEPVYNTLALINVDADPAHAYTTAVGISINDRMSAISDASARIITREKIGKTTPWTVRQTLDAPFYANTVLGNDPNTIEQKMPAAIAFSSDATWMAIGTPLIGTVAIDTTGQYIKANPSFTNHSVSGAVTLYKKDVNNYYTLVDTIINPNYNTETSALFGSSLVFSGNILYIGAPGANKVYSLEYTVNHSQTTSYNPNGSVGATLVVSSTSGIIPGMYVIGNGFADGQYVLSVVNGTTLTLSGSPTSTPSDTLTFETIGWIYGNSMSGSSSFGTKLRVSNDQNTLVVFNSTGAKVYTLNTMVSQQFTCNDLDVDDDSSHLVVAHNNEVKVYTFDGTQYVIEPQNGVDGGLSIQSAAVNGTFGTSVYFMNNSGSIIVYSADGSGIFAAYTRYDTKWVFSEIITLTSTDTPSIVVGTTQIMFTDTTGSGLYVSSKPEGSNSWVAKHTQEPIPNPYKIKKAFLYNKDLGQLIKYIDVIDPVQGKVPGIADEEIKYKTFFDPASYSIGTDAVNVNPNAFWSRDQVGMLWWDLRKAKFVNAYYGDTVYRTTMWNALAVGASIDVYEWVESDLMPSEWDAITDTPTGIAQGISGTSLYGNNVYSVRQRYDNVSKSFTNTYYFWVKNKNLTPNVPGRHISALTVANLIANPRGQGYSYLAITGQDSFSLVNARQFLKDDSVVLSIEYWLTENTTQNIHSQWKLISNDPIVKLPSSIEEKWIDSLCGMDSAGRTVPDTKQPPKLRYGIENRPRQSMFVNRVEALKEFIERVNRILASVQITNNYDTSDFDLYDPQPSANSGLYDVVLDTEVELQYANASSFILPTLIPKVSEYGQIMGVEVITSGRGYVNAPMITIVGDGTGAELRSVINENGQIIGATVINGGEGYNAATTVASVRGFSALIKSDSGASGNWSVYVYDSTTSVWSRTLTQSYDVRPYRNFVDWYATGFNQFSSPDHAVNTFVELNSITSYVGELVKVLTDSNGNWILLQKYADVQSVDWTQSYHVVGMQNGSIQLSNSLYNFNNTTIGYDASIYDNSVYDVVASTELRIILNALKNKIFIGTLRQSYLDLFLASLHYAHSEQLYLDWAFKTSFVRATHIVGELGQPVSYPVDNLANFEDYIAEVKPYRTQIREYISNYTKLDIGETAVTDFDLQPVYEDGSIVVVDSYLNNGQISVFDPVIQTYPWKFWLDEVGFTVTEIRLVNGGSGYVSQPEVTIESNSGTGAKAIAYVAGGKVNRVVLVSGGSKYLTAPTITFTGGLGTGGVSARAVAIIGESVVRSNLVAMKFDRITQNYYITDINKTETLPLGTGTRKQFPLQWAPDVGIGKSSVSVNGAPVLRDFYKLSIVKTVKNGSTQYSGSILFDTAPAEGSEIVVKYIKDISILDAADRIQYYYSPNTNQLSNNLTQLMTGVDYGGVQVTGLGFDVGGGWGKKPYATEGWDVYDKNFSILNFIDTVSYNTTSFDIGYTPDAGVELNFYYSINGSDPIRLDDPAYGTPQQTNDAAIMLPVVANGHTRVFSIPESPVNSGSYTIIIRQSTSDGSIMPSESEYDTTIIGGDMAYSTARGIAPEEIIVDGDAFVTPTSSPAPEEVVPGQVVDAVAIKVFDRPSAGTASVKVDNFRADGISSSFKLTNNPNNAQAIIVKRNTEVLTKDVDYTYDYNTNTLSITNVPDIGEIISAFSIGFSGQNILDLDYFVGDGSTTEFITHAAYLSGNVTAIVYLDGVATTATIFETDNTYDLAKVVGLRFNSAPALGQIVNYIVVKGSQPTVAVTKSEIVPTDGSLTYQLQYPIGLSLLNESNMLVRVDQTILTGPNNSYFTITGNKLNYTIDGTKVIPNSVEVSDIAVIANGTLLELGVDYTVDLSGITIKLNKTSQTKYKGKQLVVAVTRDSGYTYNPTTNEITFAEAYDNTHVVEVISSYIHDTLDIQRTDLNVSPTLSITVSDPEYFKYRAISSGLVQLDRPVIDDNYVWVIKNNTLLTPTIDYSVRDDLQSIRMASQLEATDKLAIITFGANVLPVGIAYMQFKDMLNRTTYKRLNANKQTRLLRDLDYNDTSIEVENASNFERPNLAKGRPGIIEVRGERIEYYSIKGNILSKLRRATMGTGAPYRHKAGSYVTDIGGSETIPYADNTITEQVVSDGTSTVALNQITPGGFDTTYSQWNTNGSNTLINMTVNNYTDHAKDSVEIFVGGYDDAVVWSSGTQYVVGAIVQVGTYTYRCLTAHTSASTFTADSGNWEFFVGNIRLKKDPYSVFNVNVAPYSPAGDVAFPADFTVDGVSKEISLTNTLRAGTKVTVARRVGYEWDSLLNIQEADTNIARFLKAQPGTWYTDARQFTTGPAPSTFDSTIATFDSDTNTFDRGN